MIHNVERVLSNCIYSVARIHISECGDAWSNVSHICGLVFVLMGIFIFLIEYLKFIIVSVPIELAFDNMRESVDDSVKVEAPHLNTIICTRRNVADDLYLNAFERQTKQNQKLVQIG